MASYACGSGSRSGTCFCGELSNIVLTFVRQQIISEI